jgi:riboflavin kinase/FMN adenylyltransferase
MIVASSLAEIAHNPDSLVTIGTFDGVHLGHRDIIGELIRRSRKRPGGRSVVITFEPHPREVLGRGHVTWLSSLGERLTILEELGVDAVLVIAFTYEFSRQSSREFVTRTIVQGIGVSEMIVGFDHMFGRDREGGIRELRELGHEFRFSVRVVDPVSLHGEVVSSSTIREQLLHGNVERAREYLGRPFSVEGLVVRGEGRGVSLGFPTTNLRQTFERQLLPADGVYAVRVVTADGNERSGMAYIGVRPTFAIDHERVLEVNIFDFEENLYGSTLRVRFLKRLRPDKKFASPEELIAQMHKDKTECMKIIEPSPSS